MVSSLYRLVITSALLVVGAVLPATAALITPPVLASAGDPGGVVDHDITGLTIDVVLNTTHPTGDITHLAYEVAIGDDGTPTTWAVVEFAVIREWHEGAVMGGAESPASWSGDVLASFADWTTGGAGIGEGESLGGFGYTVARSTVPSQMYIYRVSKDGGIPFQVISNSLPVLASSGTTVPEPASATLVVGSIVALWAVRRRGVGEGAMPATTSTR